MYVYIYIYCQLETFSITPSVILNVIKLNILYDFTSYILAFPGYCWKSKNKQQKFNTLSSSQAFKNLLKMQLMQL